MNREQIQHCKDVYDRMIQGAYDPADLQLAYQLITGDEMMVHVRAKRQAINAWHTYSFDATMLAVAPDNGSNLNHTHTESEVQISTSGDTETVTGSTVTNLTVEKNDPKMGHTESLVDLPIPFTDPAIPEQKKVTSRKKPTATKKRRTRKPKTDES